MKNESSIIDAVDYNKELLEMEICFKHGSVHRYYDVPKDIYIALVNASSSGRYFNKNIYSTFERDKLV